MFRFRYQQRTGLSDLSDFSRNSHGSKRNSVRSLGSHSDEPEAPSTMIDSSKSAPADKKESESQ